ncbi:MAG: A24 family peptidase [Hyphomicrobiales bacterium]|nr:A24 family peptidase [Hyphomicrobiales bacterium]
MTADIPLIFAALAAPFTGSFIATAVDRCLDGKDWIWSRSVCDSCARRLAAHELVPICSWLWLKGVCPSCTGPIAARYLIAELAALGVVLWAVAKVSPPFISAAILLGWLLLALSLFDLRAYILPNALTLTLFGFGATVRHLADPASLAEALASAAAGGAALLAFRSLYQWWRGRAGLGLGDVKLFAAAGVWTSWQGLAPMLLIACLSALIYGLILWRRRGGDLRAQKLPFGPFLCLGLWLTWLYNAPSV